MDLLVLFEELNDFSSQIITDVIFYKNQFAGKMMKYIIYGFIDEDRISATYQLPDGKIDLQGVVLEYRKYSNNKLN